MKPIVTEKAVMMIELQNVLTFVVDARKTKEQIRHDVEELFEVKVATVRTLKRGTKKYAYVQLKKDFPAIDIATKIGLM